MGEKPPKEAPDFTSGHRKRMREKLRHQGLIPFAPGIAGNVVIFQLSARGCKSAVKIPVWTL